MGDVSEILYQVSLWVLPVLVAVTFHEAAHGFAAWRLGDPTAWLMGRVSFNPLKHIDPFGTVLLPALLLFASGGRMMFGFAKPVPVNFARLRHPRRDMVLVAVAGPLTNVALAFVSGALFHVVHLLPETAQLWAALNLRNSMLINALLCIFNMMPIPPLDGGRVAVGVLPRPMAMRLARLERAGLFIIIGALFILPWIGGRLGVDLNVFWWLVVVPADAMIRAIVYLLGL